MKSFAQNITTLCNKQESDPDEQNKVRMLDEIVKMVYSLKATTSEKQNVNAAQVLACL